MLSFYNSYVLSTVLATGSDALSDDIELINDLGGGLFEIDLSALYQQLLIANELLNRILSFVCVIFAFLIFMFVFKFIFNIFFKNL